MAIQMWHCIICGSSYQQQLKAEVCETKHTKLTDLTIENIFFEPTSLAQELGRGPFDLLFKGSLGVPDRVELRYGKGEEATAFYKKEQ